MLCATDLGFARAVRRLVSSAGRVRIGRATRDRPRKSNLQLILDLVEDPGGAFDKAPSEGIARRIFAQPTQPKRRPLRAAPTAA
jgi:hypothetical protein